MTTSNSAIGGKPEYKHLNRMLDGYHQFLSLRKASYAMVEDLNMRKLTGEEIFRSHFDNAKKICKIGVRI